jgi:hypothetical protein
MLYIYVVHDIRNTFQIEKIHGIYLQIKIRNAVTFFSISIYLNTVCCF